MNKKRISLSYANGLACSLETSELLRILREYKEFLYVFNDYSNTYMYTITNPRFTLSEKIHITTLIFFKNKHNKYFRNFIFLLIKKKRLEYVNDIYLCYKAYVNKISNNVDLFISYYNSDGKQFINGITNFLKTLKLSNINLQLNSDSSLISGYKVRMENHIIDASMETKLKDLHKLLKKISF